MTRSTREQIEGALFVAEREGLGRPAAVALCQTALAALDVVEAARQFMCCECQHHRERMYNALSRFDAGGRP